jgi:hypothetical protein
MCKRIALLWFVFGIAFTGFSQTGSISGKITNSRNEQLVGVTVKIEGLPGAITTDIDGRYTIKLEASKKYKIEFTAVGYQPKFIEEVAVVAGEETTLDVLMEDSKKNQLSEVVIKGSSPRRETVNALINFQKNTPVVAQVISAEAIRRSPDKNTGEVLKRVPGTSIQEGKYLVVRGLADRYNLAMLNGVMLSSTEPDRKTFSFDIFPAAMIDNIIMNKTFIPELPGEWAGGLVQVNTKDIPSANFFNFQIGSGFNEQTIGKDFLKYKGGKTDWLGIDDGTRALPSSMPTKSEFAEMTSTQQAAIGRDFKNIWTTEKGHLPLNASFQMSGGFAGKLLGKKIGGILALNYNQNNRRTDYTNSFISNVQGDIDFVFNNKKYNKEVVLGGLANFAIQLNSNNKISFKNIINVNTNNYVTERSGKDYILGGSQGQNIRAFELGFKQNIFFNTQLLGEHNITGLGGLKFKWYGSFNILDQYIPDQRRLEYIQDETQAGDPYIALISGGNSQKSGSRFYSTLSDYIYNAGGDLAKTFNLFNYKQTAKAGYLFQIKDRLFDSRPFYYQISRDTTGLVNLPPDKIFASGNITGADNGITFGELEGSQYRYLANTILNATFIQFDNQLSQKLRIVWGVRFESFDQLVGSVKQSDPRHVHSRVNDWLPGLNLTYKLSDKTNLRLSGSQTVVRPEFRELSPFAFYDFELGATSIGNKNLQRTKIANVDLRYEIYPRAGELFTIGLFYKYFQKPIELYFNASGAGSSNTFNFANADNATGYGAELEMRKKLDFFSALKNFTVTGNFSYIFNRVQGLNIDRPMQGQSPYLINVGLQYDLEKAGLSTTVLFNQIGRRILFVGNLQQSTGVGVPEIWENPRALLDFQIAKKLLRQKGEIRLNISDIINQHSYFYHDLDGNKKFSRDSKDAIAVDRVYGSNVSLTFGYTIK